MVAFSNWPSRVQKTMQFLQGLDTFQLIVSSRNSGYLKDLRDRLSVFQDRLERFPHRSNLTLKCALHLFWRKKTWFTFQNMPKQIFRCESLWYTVFNDSQKSRNATASGCHPNRPRHLSPTPGAFHQAVKICRIHGLIFGGHRVWKFHHLPLGLVPKWDARCIIL